MDFKFKLPRPRCMPSVSVSSFAVLLHLCISISSLNAEPVLLATLPADHQCGRNVIYDAVWPVMFYSRQPFMPESVLFEDLELHGPFPMTAYDSLSIGDDRDLLVVSQYITNGIDDRVYDAHWSASGMINLILIGPVESIAINPVVPTFGPDLTGYQIESVVRNIVIDVQSPGHDPNDDGVWTDITVTGQYEFYGELIPEPSSMILLVAAFSWRLSKSRRASRLAIGAGERQLA